jgi:cytochrome b
MQSAGNTTRVWDPLVRIGHWTVVVTFFIAYFTEDDLLTQHIWAGYVVGAVIGIRLIWGFIGSKHARFSDFVRSPATALRYLRDLARHRAPRYLGHNPAGGLMIVALLITLSGTVFSGLMLYAIEENAGPLAGWVAGNETSIALPSVISAARADEDGEHGRTGVTGEEFWEELHEVLANLALLLVFLHVAGVAYSSLMEKENLVKAMLTGRKRIDDVAAAGGGTHLTDQESTS